MKTMTILMMTFIGILSLNACKKDTSTICENLAEQGGTNLTDLKGEWEFKHFAYTANGNKIKNQDEIQKGELHISDTSMGISHTNTIGFLYKLNGPNGITVNMLGSTYINPPQEENDITVALINSRCYVVKGNQLLIHYKEDDKKNVLILNKK